MPFLSLVKAVIWLYDNLKLFSVCFRFIRILVNTILRGTIRSRLFFGINRSKNVSYDISNCLFLSQMAYKKN